ncbi:hypothetical protein DM01DRAFT_163115 [Hesseltinella vesiculosa]|uniref:NUA/TPR/MLP1-2-like domain-containing protein n=1 Tax=Hesseltinella vesiculosa TaxID=101127 RepID=A0A1X2GU11_9FUNG|nr:hypothetical protein DM01DRAFT_163115 [Hesseltinella vesiculosa]
MASPETLLKDLSAETLTVEYNTLKEKYDELVKNESQSQQELTQTKLQLEQLKSTAAHSQQEKDAMELKLSDVTNNKQEFTVLINELRQSLAVQRSDNTKLSQDINDYHIKCTKIQIEKEAERHRSEALKIEVDALKLRLNSFGENLEQSRQHFLAADTEIKLINEARRRDRELALSEKSYLEQERDTLSTSIQELRYELTRANTDLHNASDRAKSAEDRCQKMEAAQLTSKKNHNDIIEVYERQRLAAEDQIAKFSAELETAQTKAQAQYTDLVDENKSLKQQLTDAHDRLAVTRNRVDQLIGKCSANGDATAPTTPGTSPSAPLLGGSLLQLVQKYESSGHYWDDIFGDYFKLQDANQRLSKINDELTAVNRRYMREKDNEREYYTRLEAEVDRLRSEQTTHANAVDELAKLKASQQEKFQALEKQIADLSRDKQDLEASLNDTTYQLRYMLRFVQYQYGALPDQVKDTHDLLKDSQIPSSLEHDKTVFKDFDEMQQRNQTLMTDIRHLEANLSQKSTQVDQLSTTLKEKEALLSDASAKSTSLIRDQREKLEAMEHRLSLTVAERDRLLKQAGVNGSMADGEADASPVAVIDTDLQDKLQQSTQKVDELTAEMDAYQQEVELEMAEIRGELKQLQGQTAQLREERNAVQLERDQLKHRNNDLLQVSKSRQNEVEDLRKRESIRDGRIGELENRLMSANNEAMNLTHQLASLRADHSSVSAQLKGYEESYQRLCVENKELANERINLTTLLQNMNENLGSCTSGTAHIVEELKEHNGRLSRELEHLRDRLRTKEKEVRALQGIDQNEWRDKFQQSSGELKQLRVNYLELEKQLATANQDRIMAQTQVSELSRQQQAQPAVTAPTDGASAGEANATTTDGTAAAASSSMEQLVSQLTDANDTVARLKQELFEYKDRLEQADATTNKVSVDFTKFSEDSQARINQLSDDLASNHDKISSLQKQLEELTNEKRDSQTAFNTAELKWQEEKQGLLQEKGTLDDKLKTALDQVANLQSELNQHVTLLKESEQRYQTEVAARTQDAEAMAKLREDVQRLTLDLSSSKAEVLSAQERLGAAELSYRTQKEQTDSSYNDMKLR